MSRSAMVVGLCLLLSPYAPRSNAAQVQMLWTSQGQNNAAEIQLANVDGSGVHPVLPVVPDTSVISVAVDSRTGMAYFGTFAADYSINRVSINGGAPTTLYNLRSFNSQASNGTPAPWGLSIDTLHNKLYWVGGIGPDNPGLVNLIQRSNLDGSNIETIRQTDGTVSSPFGIVVNGAAQQMYWTDRATRSIHRADLDGNNVETVLTGTDSMRALAIDFEHDRLFWSETTSGANSRILTARLDGSGIQTIVSGAPIPPVLPWLEEFKGLAVDPMTRKLYFTADAYFGIGGVLVCNYDGSELTTLIGQTRGPSGIALLQVPEPSTFVLGLFGIMAAAVVRRCCATRHRRFPASLC